MNPPPLPTRAASGAADASFARDVEAIQRIDVVPWLLRMVCLQTGLGCAVIARVTAETWTACAVEDQIGFGLVPGDQLSAPLTLCNEARVDRAPLVIEHASIDANYWNVDTLRRNGIESYVSVPLIRADGSYFGNLCALDRRPIETLEPRVVLLMRGFAHVILLELERDALQLSTAAELVEERSSGGAREEFIAVVSHDLRNPLGAIGATAELLARHADEDVRAASRRLLRSSHRMALMIEDLMDLARGRLGGGIHLRSLKAENLANMMQDVITELRDAHPSCLIDEQIEIEDSVHCDSLRLQQLLSNLVGNALSHGRADEAVRVDIRLRDDELTISVWNAGAPIAPADHARIFDPYWRPAGSPANGLGLGLYICRQIVKAHRGTLTVTSSADAGTCFVARIPAKAA